VNNQTVVVGKTRINTCFTIFIFVKLTTIYNTVLNEGIFDAYDSVSDDQWVAAYTNKMREANGQLMNKLESNPNYVFVLNKNMVHDECGNPNKCETNTYDLGYFHGVSYANRQNWTQVNKTIDICEEDYNNNLSRERCYEEWAKIVK